MKFRPVVVATAETIFLTLVFLLANIRSTIFWSLYPTVDAIVDPAWREIFLWLLALALMYYLLMKYLLSEAYLQTWLQQPLLITFVAFSLASVFWSYTWTVTLQRSLVFTFATAAGVFLGLRYSISNFLRLLVILGAIILTASYILIYVSPALGTDLHPGYNGAWRGIFWHKNQLGNVMPIFNLVVLIWFFSVNIRNKPLQRTFAVLLYVLSMIMIFFSESASGYILVLMIHFVFGTAMLWLKVRHLMRPSHYYVILILCFAGGAGVMLNLEFVLGLFNRSPNLTGRVPMWLILLRDIFPQKPWFGYGFGTLWADLDFRNQIRDLAGFPYPAMIADNGFLDILLNLGIVGLILFLLNYVKAWVNSVRYFLRTLSIESLLFLIFMIYTFTANLTFSLFMETEVFVWMLIVALMIATTPKNGEFLDVRQH